MGGQGAPLVSILDACLYRPSPITLDYHLVAASPDKTREIMRQVDMSAKNTPVGSVATHVWCALLNLGGIGNITLINSDPSAKMHSFDTGPANCLIDDAMRVLFNKEYDENGTVASQGVVNLDLLNEILSIPFFKQKPPRTTGRELFSMDNVKKWIETAKQNYKMSNEDIVR